MFSINQKALVRAWIIQTHRDMDRPFPSDEFRGRMREMWLGAFERRMLKHNNDEWLALELSKDCVGDRIDEAMQLADVHCAALPQSAEYEDSGLFAWGQAFIQNMKLVFDRSWVAAWLAGQWHTTRRTLTRDHRGDLDGGRTYTVLDKKFFRKEIKVRVEVRGYLMVATDEMIKVGHSKVKVVKEICSNDSQHGYAYSPAGAFGAWSQTTRPYSSTSVTYAWFQRNEYDEEWERSPRGRVIPTYKS